jgi:hypothetical protein
MERGMSVVVVAEPLAKKLLKLSKKSEKKEYEACGWAGGDE